MTDRAPPGWYQDPHGVAARRWWDGATWTGHVWGPLAAAVPRAAPAPARTTLAQRQLRALAGPFVPVLVCALLLVPGVGGLVVSAPIVPLLVVPTAALLLGVLWWLDRLEPEPWVARLYALGWGATVAVAVGGTVNAAVAHGLGMRAAVVGSAPVVEELAKGAVLIVLARRRLLDSPLDGPCTS